MIKSRSIFLPLRPSILPSWGRFSIILAVHQLLSIPFPPHPEPPTWRDSWAIISTASLHVTQEVPLPPYFQSLLSHWGQCSAWLGGELRKEVLLLMLSYFGNLVVFFLILNFIFLYIFLKFLFYSPWLLRKISQNEMREIEFLFFSLDLEFVLCLLKFMNCWNFYWIQP